MHFPPMINILLQGIIIQCNSTLCDRQQCCLILAGSHRYVVLAEVMLETVFQCVDLHCALWVSGCGVPDLQMPCHRVQGQRPAREVGRSRDRRIARRGAACRGAGPGADPQRPPLQ